MKHTLPKRRDPNEILRLALASGWQSVDTIPLKGEGHFLVLTLSGLERLCRSRSIYRNIRKADGYGPQRTSVNAIDSGNYLAAIAWKWPDS